MIIKELRKIRNLLIGLVEITLINSWIKKADAEKLIKKLVDVDNTEDDEI